MSLFTVIILSEGAPIDPAVRLLQLNLLNELNHIPFAQLTFNDGSAAGRTFSLSESETFIPGREIEIKIRWENKENEEISLFKGRVVKHNVESNLFSGSELYIELKDEAYQMTQSRKNAIFRELSDEQIVRQLFEDAGLIFTEAPVASYSHAELVQYYCTDWDFALSRIDANGWLLKLKNGEVTAADLSELFAKEPSVRIEYGLDDLINFTLSANVEGQYESVEAVNWDAASQSLIDPLNADEFNINPGNLPPTGVNTAEPVAYLQHSASLPPEELQAWADASLIKSRLAFIRGRLSLLGRTDIEPLSLIEIAGMGERFNGKAIVTGIRHVIGKSGWQTDVQIGLSPRWLTEKKQVEALPAAGLIPPLSGLRIAVVESLEADPAGQYRIKICIPGMGAEPGAFWARLASPEAGNNRGYFFRPEPGDEVVVGFLHNDPRQAIVLGSLYSSAQSPPLDSGQINEDNFVKGVFSKAGSKIEFDDEQNQISLETKEGQRLVLNGKDKKIELKDAHNNQIVMDKNGVTIKSAKNLVLEASKEVRIKGSKVNVN